jgi:enolase
LSNFGVLEIFKDVVDELSGKLGYNIRIGIDVAASSFYDKGYKYNNYSNHKKKVKLSREEQVEFMSHIVKKYKIGYLEDPLEENDFEGFAKLRRKVKNCMVVGDDLTVTNPKRVEKSIKGKCIDGLIIKPNQIGSLMNVKKVVDICKLNKIKTIFSHRAGETKEDFLADLSYIFGSDLIKCGIYGKERVSKLNRLKKIRKGL